MKKIFPLILIILFSFPIISPAVTVQLHDGTTINLEGLSDAEISTMIQYIDKINKTAQGSATQTAADAFLESASDPAKLGEWRELITGTIRDIAEDLNVTVNEFVKTPVGLGTAGLIFYKVAGKDMIEAIVDIILVIPFWMTIMVIILYTTRHFLGHVTEHIEVKSNTTFIHDEKVRDEVEKYIETNEELPLRIPVRVCRYNWTSKDARTAFSCCMVGIPIVVTIAAFVIVFT